MGTEIRLRHPETGETRLAPTGFSWTTFFFGGIPAFFFRRDRGKRGAVMLAATIVGLLVGASSSGALQIPILIGWLIVALRYNEWYIRDLLRQGYLPQDEASREALARAGYGDADVIEQGSGPSAPAKGTAEAYILQQAAARGGIVSPVIIATDGAYSLDEAKRELDRLVDAGHAELRVSKRTGELVYAIPGLLDDRTREDLESLT